MWILDKKTKSFQAKTTVAPVIPLTFNIIYKTKTLKAETNDLPYSDTGNISEVYSNIVTPPYGDGIKKDITYIQVYNPNILEHEVTFSLLDNGTNFVVFSCILQPGWAVEWSEDERWLIYNESGIKKNDSLDEVLQIILDETADPIKYVGYAVPGTLTSEALWRIKRIDVTSGVIVKWADGNGNFDNIWDNRVILSYS